MILNSPTISGSLTVTGNIIASGSITLSGSVASASYASNAELLDGLDSTVFTLTSSFAAQTASFTAFTSSINSYTSSQNILNGTYATTGSNTFTGIQTINSNLTVTGSITAQTLIVSTINATQSYSSGSNIFGNSQANTQTFTGSLLLTGSATFNGALTAGATTLNGNLEFASGYFINMPWASDTRTMWERYFSGTYFQRISSNGSLRQLRIESNGAYGNASIVLDGQSNTTVTTTITSDKFVVVGASAFTSSAASPFTLYATDGSGEGHKIQWQTAYGPNRIVADIRGNASGAGGAFIIRVADTSATLQERLTITNVGKVTIPSGANGTSYFSMNYTSSNAASREWQIGSDQTAWGAFSIAQATTQGGSTFSDKIVITSGGVVQIAGLTSNGTVSTQSSNGSLYVSSDANLKIEDGFVENGLEKVLALKPRYFYWKDKEAFSADRQLGFYAQEVNAISEETANTPLEGCGWGIYDRGLVALLTKAIQELKSQNDALQSRIETLESK